jgi:hypothetical protein
MRHPRVVDISPKVWEGDRGHPEIHEGLRRFCEDLRRCEIIFGAMDTNFGGCPKVCKGS